MSFPTVRAGLHANLRTYTGVKNILGGMPTAIHTTPAIITQFLSGELINSSAGVYHWRFQLHVITDHQANDIAETEVDTMIPLLYQAISQKLNDSGGHRRATLGGAAAMCWFEDVRSGDTDGYITFGSGDGEKKYRRIGLVAVVKTHEEY